MTMWTYEPRPEDLITGVASPWHAALRATLGPQCATQSRPQAMTGVVLSALHHTVADGEVLTREPTAAAGWRPLSGRLLADWAVSRVSNVDRLTAEEWDQVATAVRAQVLADNERAQAEMPADARRAAELLATQRRRDRLVALDRQRADIEAERAVLARAENA